jgi:beta-glucanase (GH16 family)
MYHRRMRYGVGMMWTVLFLLAADWKLVWSDEFNKPGAPDPAKWTFEEGYIRNREAQYYRPENARVENGSLVIDVRKEQFPNPKYQQGSEDWRRVQFAEYTSASLTTEGKASWTYGRFEIRAKFPRGRGIWPAIWTLGTNRRTAGWPTCGEIDIAEYFAHTADELTANVHMKKYNHAIGTGKGAKTTLRAPWEDFHVYALEWTPEKMEFFVDGRKYFEFANEHSGPEAWPFDQPQYLILNVAVGGSAGGKHGIDPSIWPQKMEIDYVRVYQRP